MGVKKIFECDVCHHEVDVTADKEKKVHTVYIVVKSGAVMGNDYSSLGYAKDALISKAVCGGCLKKLYLEKSLREAEEKMAEAEARKSQAPDLKDLLRDLVYEIIEEYDGNNKG